MNAANTSVALSRRRFLAASGAALTVTFVTGCALPVIPKRPKPTTEDARGWIRHADGRYTLFIPRVEMGQNIATALKQIACEELDVPWDAVTVQLHATADIGRVRATVGSDSIKDFALPLAQACATLRDALAAGQVSGTLPARELAPPSLRAFRREQRRHVGRAPVLEQGEQIVRGAPLYAADERRPGQLFGRVLRAPASPELPARVRALDEQAAARVPGFVALVRDAAFTIGASEGVGIVTRTPGALDRVAAAMAPSWQVEGQFEQADIDALIDVDRALTRGSLRHSVHGDRIGTDPASWDVDLRIDLPLAAHAPLEPRAAVAEFGTDGRLQVWVGTQDVFYQRDVIAARMDLAADRIVVHGRRVGGGFGGKTLCIEALEAAVLARAVGAPVKVQWTRAQEFQQAFHRPPSSHRIRVRLRDGRLQTWWHAFVSSHILFTNAVLPTWLQRLTDFIGDDGVARGAALPYACAQRRTEFDAVRLPVFTGPWRGLGAGPNVFAIESAIDECARRAGADPVAFRLAHIEDPRLARVLARLAAHVPPPAAAAPGLLRGRGVACGIYKAMSYAAVIADVEVERASGQVRVTRLWCAHDCGQVINPDQVRAQCEGNLVWGLGMVLHEALPIAQSAVAARTFADAPIPTMADVPPMDVLLVDEGEPPSGAGETAIVASGAAIANAIRAATGLRPQRYPVRPAQLKAALDERVRRA